MKTLLVLIFLLVASVVSAHHLRAYFYTGYTNQNIYVYWVENQETRKVYCYVYGPGYENDFYVGPKYYDSDLRQWVNGYSRTFNVPNVPTQFHCE